MCDHKNIKKSYSYQLKKDVTYCLDCNTIIKTYDNNRSVKRFKKLIEVR